MFASKVAKAQTKAPESQTNRLAPQRPTLVARPFADAAVEQAHILHRSIGNEATLRLLTQRASSLTGNEPNGHNEQEGARASLTIQGETPGVSWDFSKIPIFPRGRTRRPQVLSLVTPPPLPGGIHAKLAVGPVDDPLEHEADRVADQVMRISGPDHSIAAAPPQLSRKCAACEEEEEKLQKKAAGLDREAGEVPAIVHDALRSPGQAKVSTPALRPNPPIAGPSPEETPASELFAPAYSLAGMTLFAAGEDGEAGPRARTTLLPLRWPLQAKLEVGAANDPLEREADQLAEHVMRMPDPAFGVRPTVSGAASGVQRKCTCGGSCETCKQEQSDEEHRCVQRMAAGARASVQTLAPPIVHDVLRSPGQPLDPATRAFMEPRFGYDFSQVRLHVDQQAADSAKAIRARAYTVGRDVVFAKNEPSISTCEGKRLLAHELAHVAQQAGGNASVVRRDLATPPPDPAVPEQGELTPAQIRDAIYFNSQRYDAANTKLIQKLLGGPQTGQWSKENIEAIAATQEQYGLKKDGKVGPDTFRFLDKEQTAEGMDTSSANCLTSFQVTVFPLVDSSATPGPGGTVHIEGHHHIDARFSPRCDCSKFEYRQFIAGVATASRGAVTRDISNAFNLIPGGSLPITEVEDGSTACTSAVHYGHRDEAGNGPGGTACAENRYRDDDGKLNQRSGCHFSAEDRPDLTVTGLNSGVTVNLEVDFRGEIRRAGRVIQTRRWTTVDTNVTVP